jgi:signal transduction histidine kinase
VLDPGALHPRDPGGRRRPGTLPERSIPMEIGSVQNQSSDEPVARILQLRDRWAALGQVSANLMQDMASALSVLEARARVAAAEARAGRAPASDLEQVAESSAELKLMVSDTLDVVNGRAISPEVRFDVYSVVERACRRFFPGSRGGVEVRLRSELPAGVEVEGRASFLMRAVANLLANALRHCRSEVQVGVSIEDPRRMDEDADAVVCIDVEDDGAGLDLARAATLFEPAPFGQDEPGVGLSAVAWMVSQLGGWVRHRPGDDLGGACFEIRLPVRAEANG